ncbi:MAG: enolase C-terminal domain-like protein [Tepidisphaeraceae bacterium]
MSTDVRVIDAQINFGHAEARTPYKFGNALLKTITRADVTLQVQDRQGRVASGRGTMFLSHLWAFPSTGLTLDEKDAAMRIAARGVCRALRENPGFGHPVDLFLEAATAFERIQREAVATIAPETMLPRLAMLVCASPADAALHDAYGRLHGVSTYDTYGPQFMRRDLSEYLHLPALRGQFLQTVLRPPAQRVPVFHTVGGTDALSDADQPADAPRDGLPNSLTDWIGRDGLRNFKIKLSGLNVEADRSRLLAIWDTVVAAVGDWRAVRLTIDPNEQCESPRYMIDLLQALRADRPAAYEAIVLIEQPTARDLLRDRHDMHALSRLKPTLIDESLTEPADLETAHALGWSGVVLKACKCQTLTLLTSAKARAMGLMTCVADLTNPGSALLQSVGLAARLPTVAGLEANCRQYFPAAVVAAAEKYPSAVRVHEGAVSSESIGGIGLGYAALD